MCLCGKSQATNQIGTQTETGSTASRLTHGRDEYSKNSKSSSGGEGNHDDFLLITMRKLRGFVVYKIETFIENICISSEIITITSKAK